MRLILYMYWFILYISVALTFLHHFKRYAISMNNGDNSALLISAKIVAWTWPIYIPISYLCQFLYSPDLEVLCQDLDKKYKK